jgi:hypothetical protein
MKTSFAVAAALAAGIGVGARYGHFRIFAVERANIGGTSGPSAFAVFRLTTSSNLTRRPRDHRRHIIGLTVDFTDETENGRQKTQLRKLGRDFPKRSMIRFGAMRQSSVVGPDSALKVRILC